MQLGGVMNKYSQHDFDTSEALLSFLNTGADTFKALGQAANETWAQGLKTEFMTARRGVNPLTSSKQALGRQEMQRNTWFRILQQAETKLMADYEATLSRINEAEALVGQIVIAALQAGQLTDEMVARAKEQADFEQLWRLLSSDANINVGQKRVLLLVSEIDALILFGDVLNKITQ